MSTNVTSCNIQVDAKPKIDLEALEQLTFIIQSQNEMVKALIDKKGPEKVYGLVIGDSE